MVRARRWTGWVAAAVAAVSLVSCTSTRSAAPRTQSPGSRASSSPAVFPDPDGRALPPTQSRALQVVLDGVVSDEASLPGSGVPGLTAAVLTDHGAWTGAAGKDGDGAALRPNTMMLVASITKTFLAAEVLHLVDTGRVDLHAPLSRYVDHPLAANGATVQQALSMRGGFRDRADAELDRAVARAAASPQRRSTVQDSLAFWSAASTKPGGDPVYSSTGYVLLGMLVEGVTHRHVAQVLRADLFSRAQLERVAAQDAEAPTAPIAAPRPELGIRTRDGYMPCRSLATMGNDSASGLAADASAVARWGYQLYGGRVLPAGLTAAMMTAPSPTSIFPGTGYGLGTMLFDGVSVDAAVGHDGDFARYTSILVVIPARHLSIAVLAAGHMQDSRLMARQLLQALPASTVEH